MVESSGGCCRCCTSFIFTLGLTALFMWLSLRTSNPTCSIQSFEVPALNLSQNSTKNTTIYFLLKLDNGNKDKGIHYDNISLTVTYRTNISLPLNASQPIKKFDVPGFYQGHNKKAKKNQSFVPDGFNWTAATRAVSINGSTVFRVDLATRVRFKIIFWNTKRHKLSVGADVVVNKMGEKDKKKGIKLSGGPQLGRFPLRVGVLVNLLAFIFLNSW